MADHTLFLFGTLRDPVLRAAVLGREVETRPASLPGYRAMRVEGETFPVAIAAPGHAMEGLLVTLDDEQLARVVHFEGEVAYGLGDVEVEAEGGPVPARMFTADATPSADPWDIDAWRPRGRPFMVECAREIMGLYEAGVAMGSGPALFKGVKTRALARVAAMEEVPRKGLATPEPADAESLRIDRPYAGFFAVEEHHVRHPRFDGGMTPELRRIVFSTGDAVTVAPYDPALDAVLLITQWRAGPHARGDRNPWPLEVIAGRIDSDEAPEEAARREASEEARLELGRMKKIAAFYPSPGCLAEYVTAFIGEADLSGAGGVHGNHSEAEEVFSRVVPLDEALEMVAEFEANTSPVLVTLLWLAANRDKLRREWGV